MLAANANFAANSESGDTLMAGRPLKRKRMAEIEEEDTRIEDLDVEKRIETLERQNEMLTKQLAGLQKTSDGTMRITGKPVIRDEDRLEKFLNTAPDRWVVFSDSPRLQSCVKRGSHISTVVGTGAVISSPDLILRFSPYHGPGSEIPRPDAPEKPVFVWGTLNIESVPEVVRGDYSVDEVLEMLQATEAWRKMRIFDGEEAQSRIRPEYESKKRMDAERKRREERLAALPEGAFKAGSLVL